MNVTIRPAQPSDRASWEPLWNGYMAFYKKKVREEQTELTWQRMLGANADMFCLIAADDEDNAVGIAQCVVHPSTWTELPYCYLEDLFVSPALRGGGIARKLIEAIYARAEAENWAKVYWVTEQDNHVAQALYDKLATNEHFIQYRQ